MKKIILATLVGLILFSPIALAGTFKKGGVCWAGNDRTFNCSCIDEKGLSVDQIYAKGFKIVAVHPESTRGSTTIYIEQQ
ncbi:TPA: hypothetical protein LCO34_003813 [Acinetobacter baumannii]|uniref:hypothetical protein n=1 Tax=Acinetobacter baumannii TaxID=470 RepID=UPI0007094E7E|nr:hypothetical protein [Acinetobacter baumannii]EIO2226973.1 hypothetical protein [Acinetobacter baumannii]EKU2468179.1 hypothetical protein [Acinetobacter baumannii]EKU2475680.1 hypothetical protein [Acinetobacter baumannii]EKV7790413.1 hypothetical protein [Acinetobacter baumannii]EKW1714347.1 hypothetical protein [Acinetobacter baumannii]